MNVFDDLPTQEPTTLRVGDRWAWTRADLSGEYPTATYALTYVARMLGDGTKSISISASNHVVTVASATTAAYTAGTYAWAAYITRTADSQRVQIASGQWTVLPNSSATTDPRSWAQKTLDMVETYLADSSNITAASYAVSGRSLSRYSITELLKLRSDLKAEVIGEKRAEEIAKGLGTGAKIRVRFVN